MEFAQLSESVYKFFSHKCKKPLVGNPSPNPCNLFYHKRAKVLMRSYFYATYIDFVMKFSNFYGKVQIF